MKAPIGLIAAVAASVVLSAGTRATQSIPSIEVTAAWIRWLPAGVPSGGYMTLTNTGAASQVLIGADSPEFGAVSVHHTDTRNGVSEMASVNSLLIKPHSSLQFAPGGYHLMLMQPKRALQPGDHAPITLRFADGGSLQVSFEVRGADQ
jgi:hypothetical protein